MEILLFFKKNPGKNERILKLYDYGNHLLSFQDHG